MEYRWKNRKPPLRLVLDLYDAYLRAGENERVAGALGIPTDRLQRWLRNFPEIREIKKLAVSRRAEGGTFKGYIFKHLSEQARKVWEQIQFWENNTGYEQVQRILSGHTKALKQELFVYALVSSSFDISEALRILAMPRSAFEHWRNEDFEFRQLIEEIQFHKKNFFERSLVNLVEQQHPSAVLFVNRTINADRGYGEKMEVKHSLEVGIRIEELDLDVDTQRKILEAVRRKKEKDKLLGPVDGYDGHGSAGLKAIADRRRQAIDVEAKPVVEKETAEHSD